MHALDLAIILSNDSADMVTINACIRGGFDVIDMDVVLVDQNKILFQMSRNYSMDAVVSDAVSETRTVFNFENALHCHLFDTFDVYFYGMLIDSHDVSVCIHENHLGLCCRREERNDSRVWRQVLYGWSQRVQLAFCEPVELWLSLVKSQYVKDTIVLKITAHIDYGTFRRLSEWLSHPER